MPAEQRASTHCTGAICAMAPDVVLRVKYLQQLPADEAELSAIEASEQRC